MPAERAAFLTYVDLLRTWQGVYRLVGSSEREWIIDDLILDSLLFVRFLPARARSVLDFGSGAGIPGIPLSVVRPTVRFTLLEARRRFVKTAAETKGQPATGLARPGQSQTQLRMESELHLHLHWAVQRRPRNLAVALHRMSVTG